MSLQSTDTVANLATQIRNAILVSKNVIELPSSKLSVSVLECLKKAGYIKNVEVKKAAPRDRILVTINDIDKNATITEIKKISTPGRRTYVGYADIPKVKSGRGIAVVSTPKGILTGDEAKKAKIGGELLLTVY